MRCFSVAQIRQLHVFATQWDRYEPHCSKKSANVKNYLLSSSVQGPLNQPIFERLYFHRAIRAYWVSYKSKILKPCPEHSKLLNKKGQIPIYLNLTAVTIWPCCCMFNKWSCNIFSFLHPRWIAAPAMFHCKSSNLFKTYYRSPIFCNIKRTSMKNFYLPLSQLKHCYCSSQKC